MDSKLPKPSGLRAPQPVKQMSTLSAVSRTAASSLTNFSAFRLKRRSKSYSDLRSVTAKPLRTPLATIPAVTTQTKARTAVKRPAAKTEDNSKPKVARQAKVPDWDYKTRFQILNEKHTKLQSSNDELKAKLADLADVDKKYTTLKMTLDKLQKEHKVVVLEKGQLVLENTKLNKTNTDLSNKLESRTDALNVLETEHNTLLAEYRDLKEKHTRSETEHVMMCKLIDDRQKEIIKFQSKVEKLQEDIDKSEDLRRKLHNTIQDLKGNIRVFCRVRPPINADEMSLLQCNISYTDDNCIEIRKSKESINVISGKAAEVKADFIFDRVFDSQSTQVDVFEELSQLVQSALDGYDVCVFAYGQTGSGKTYTMQGEDDLEHLGMIPRTVDLIFEKIEVFRRGNWVYEVRASFLEIYNEMIRDLLVIQPSQNLDIRYNEGKGTTVVNLSIEQVHNADELKELMRIAQNNRMVAATNFNEHSSRSHAVTKIYLEGRNTISNVCLNGSVNLVDLAGSECAKYSCKERLTETKNINKSLSTLGGVMLALYNKDKHIPYRNSKLTYLLQSCLGGTSKTLMVVNVAPFEENYGETLSSLRFASQVKEVKTTIKKNKIKSINSATPNLK